MRIFKIFNRDDQIRTRNNRDNIYPTLVGAKTALRLFLKKKNRNIKDKNQQLKAEDCSIREYRLIPLNEYKL